jgi:hypothetical protein
MEDAMRCFRFLAVSLAACATGAYAGALDDAKALLDQAAPADCELLMMKYQASSLPASSDARNAVVNQMKSRTADRERDLVADRLALDAARAALTQAQRTELDRHAMGLYKDCAARAEAAYHVQVPAVPARSPKQLKAVPYAPPEEKSAIRSAERPAGAVQKATVDP